VEAEVVAAFEEELELDAVEAAEEEVTDLVEATELVDA